MLASTLVALFMLAFRELAHDLALVSFPSFVLAFALMALVLALADGADVHVILVSLRRRTRTTHEVLENPSLLRSCPGLYEFLELLALCDFLWTLCQSQLEFIWSTTKNNCLSLIHI